MMTTRHLLVELQVEELPPKALDKLGKSFAQSIADGLRARGLAAAEASVTPYASPRRLAVLIGAVRSQADDRAVQLKLMPVSVALTAEGLPTPALLKKLAAVGLDAGALPQLQRRVDGKAEALFHASMVRGASLAEGLQASLDEALAALPIPKVMKYQLDDGWTSVQFVRPAHGLVALHGADIVPVQALGLKAGRQTRGHRFEAPMDPVVLQDAEHYARQLEEQGAVIASFSDRRSEIKRQIDAAASQEGLAPIEDDALLDEVSALVERPQVMSCSFEPEFLAVPQECLILTMKANQKYFPLLDAAGKLTHRFLVVSNIRPADPSRVIGGNERVVRPRLADAKFFFDQDRRKTLASRVPELAKVVYHNQLGTQGERVERVRSIARAIGDLLGGPVLAGQADQAAMLAKADLLTDMVGEFPELQGIMGCYYARHDGLSDAVAFAIEDHYRPRFAGDGLPRNDTGLVVALADKLETLAGLFGIGQLPTGDRDPFALRRHALGLIRMLIERELALELDVLVEIAFGAFPADHGQAQAELHYFLRERLVGYLREAGYQAQDVEAVVEARPAQWAQFPKRLDAVRAFKQLPEAQPLAAANKRVSNILKKSEAKVAPVAEASLFVEAAERSLHEALLAVAPRSEAAFDAGDYTSSLQLLAALKAPVDAFFDQVMVNVDDPALRANRLGLLAQLHAAMNRVADLSRLAA